MSNLLDVIDRVTEHKPVPFIAPIPDEGHIKVHVFQDSILYRFDVYNADPGWWMLSPNGNRAHVSRSAHPHEYLAYLQHLPRFYVIACYALNQNTWLVIPFNASDARQRGWPGGRPQSVHLVRGMLKPFDVVDTRSLAGILLYNQVTGLEMEKTEQCKQFMITGSPVRGVNQNWMNAVVLVDERRKQLEQQAAEARRQAVAQALAAKRQTVEDRIKFDLEFMGAELVDWSETGGGGVEVTWTFNGYTHTERLNRRGRLDVPGICLGHNETDYNWHNLSTLVDTIETGRKMHRFDIPREAWL